MKVLVLVVSLLAIAISAFALPTYTSNSGSYGAGTYGQTQIPIVFDDETGKQLFDGEYGGYDWMDNPGGVQSVADYLARYDQENGYAFGWVVWYNEIAVPTITFDMVQPFSFNSIGVHGYENGHTVTYMPDNITIAFSSDGITFLNSFTHVFPEAVDHDIVLWRTFDFTPTQARFARLTFETPYFSYRLDEISINGMDGAQFAASVPEPSSLIALGVLLTPLLASRRRR